MWILPKNLQLSSGAPDTAGFISDLNEQSQICASSLMVRSKPSQPRIWSQKWKRDSWTQHLSGRILKPSHARSFATAWASLSPVIPASHFQQQASVSEPKTIATSGRTSQEQLELFAPDFVSSRMSKDISASDSAKSLESWEQSVTRRRGEYSLRVKSARLTSASGSSSWPSPIASEVRQGFQDRSRGMKGSQESLTTVVVKEAANWLTPATVQIQRTDMQKRIDYRASIGRKYVPGSLEEQMQQHGLPAPENPSTLGSRQGLSEPSQQNWQTFAHGTHNRGETPHRQVVRALVHGEKVQTQMLTVDQVFAEEIKGTNKLWPTITAHTPDMESNGPNGHSGTYLAGAVKAEENWVTPRTSGTSTRPNKTTPRQGLTLIEQARANEWRTPTVAEEKNQNTSKQVYLQNQVGATPKQWATPRNCGGPDYAKTQRPTSMSNSLSLPTQVAGKLNPRWVETLMGLPVGWTMPSCKSPVTIELTNCASSATESCQPQQNELLES